MGINKTKEPRLLYDTLEAIQFAGRKVKIVT